MVSMWFLGAALAGTLSGWSITDDTWFVEDAVLVDAAEGRLQVDHAYLFEVRTPEGEPGGLVMVGEADVQLHAGSEMQAQVVANRLAVQGTSARELVSVARGTWTGEVDRAVWLGRGVQLPDGAVRVEGRRGVVSYADEGGRTQVVVTSLMGLDLARLHAREVLQDRVVEWRDRWMDPEAVYTLDALEDADDRWLGGLRVVGDAVTPWREGRWATWTHDPSGVLRADCAGEVRGAVHEPALWCDPLPATATGTAASDRWELLGAGVTAAARVEPAGTAADVGVVADLKLRAHGAARQVVVLDLPHHEQLSFVDGPPLPNGFDIASISLEGDELEVVPVPLTAPQTYGRGHIRTVAVRLPEPVAADESVVLRVRWSDRRRYAHVIKVEGGNAVTFVQLDVSTGLVPVMPIVRGHDGSTVPVTLRAGVVGHTPADDVIATGREVAREGEGTGRAWVTTETHSAAARFAAGRFEVGRVAGSARRPTVETYLHHRADAMLEARRLSSIAELIDPVIPAWPETVRAASHDSVYQGVPLAYGLGGGALDVRPAYENNQSPPIFSPGSHLATALAHDRWFDRDRTGEAAEVAVIGGWLVGWWALQAAGEERDQDHWIQVMRSESHPRGAGSVRYGHEGYHRLTMAAEALPAAFGEHAVRQAFTEVLAGRYPTSWAGVAQALEDASGIEAHGYVTLWLASDVRPSLSVTWRHDADSGELVARVDSDVPHGSMPLVLRLHGEGGPIDVPLSLHDGMARARVPWEGDAPRRLSIDPGPHAVASTSVRRVGSPH